MANNNQEFMNRMINMFIRNSENAIEEFNILLPQKKWQEIGEAAHKILPSYRHLKVDHIVTLLTQIKVKTLVDQDYNEVPSLLNSANEQIEALIPELKKEIK